MLTPEQIEQYHEDGYFFTGKIIDDDLLEALREEEYRFRVNPIWEDHDVTEGTTLFRSQLQAYSEVIQKIGLHGAHVPAIKQLIGDNVIFWFSQFVTKMPDANSQKSEFPWHQDNGYALGITPSNNITVWVALDDVDENNGCVYVMPGSHKQGLIDHSESKETWHLRLEVEGTGVPAILKAGEAVAFTGLTLHRSLLNHTSKPRRGFFMEYADADAMERVNSDNPRYMVDRRAVLFVSGQSSLERLTEPPSLE